MFAAALRPWPGRLVIGLGLFFFAWSACAAQRTSRWSWHESEEVFRPAWPRPVSLLCAAPQKDVLESVKNEPDPARRSEQALTLAETQFEVARAAYAKNDQAAGDTGLDTMTTALDAAVKSLSLARKSKLYKRAELRVAHLQRRMAVLLDDLNLDQRGWAEQTSRHLSEIHEKLLLGAMEK